MQDGAPPHTAGETIDLLHQLFGNRVIGLDTVHECAPHSPELNPLDFLFWGTAKGQVYANKPQTLAVEVEEYCYAITPATCRQVVENFGVRIKTCLNRGGAQIQNVNYNKQYNK